jgi:tetratricopeptide (TPR) repeat protein
VERLGATFDGEPAVAHVFDLHHCIGQYHLYGDALVSGVEDYARRLLELAGRRQARRAEAFAWCLLGEALLLRGRFDEARSCLVQSTELHASFERISVGLPWQRLAELHVCQGDFAAADAALTKGMAIATVSPLARHLWGRLYATQAFLELERGNPEAAIRCVERAAGAAARHGDCGTCGALMHPVAPEAHARLGSVDGAARHAQMAAQVADQFESAAWRAMARSAAGQHALARGDVDVARLELVEAVALYERAEHHYWADRERQRLATLAA